MPKNSIVTKFCHLVLGGPVIMLQRVSRIHTRIQRGNCCNYHHFIGHTNCHITIIIIISSSSSSRLVVVVVVVVVVVSTC